VLYQQQGKLEQAVGYFERFFELARSLGEHLQYGSGMPCIIICYTYDRDTQHGLRGASRSCCDRVQRELHVRAGMSLNPL
jgi:hypothetical protein